MTMVESLLSSSPPTASANRIDPHPGPSGLPAVLKPGTPLSEPTRPPMLVNEEGDLFHPKCCFIGQLNDLHLHHLHPFTPRSILILEGPCWAALTSMPPIFSQNGVGWRTRLWCPGRPYITQWHPPTTKQCTQQLISGREQLWGVEDKGVGCSTFNP